jgi:hypothetical protein
MTGVRSADPFEAWQASFPAVGSDSNFRERSTFTRAISSAVGQREKKSAMDEGRGVAFVAVIGGRVQVELGIIDTSFAGAIVVIADGRLQENNMISKGMNNQSKLVVFFILLVPQIPVHDYEDDSTAFTMGFPPPWQGFV